MVGSLTISYGRKRNVGGRVLRNFGKKFNRYFGGHVSREDMTGIWPFGVECRCKYVLVDSKRDQ